MQVFFHESYEGRTQVPGHPESPERISVLLEMLRQRFPRNPLVRPTPASEEDLLAVHARGYIDRVREHPNGFIDADSLIHDGTFEMALLSAGGALNAMEFTLSENKASYVIPRPPGHHAGPDYSGGFCYFNNAALAASMALKSHRKVAVVDIDVHHGNGTNEIFHSDPNLLFISTHQWGIFPGTGPPDDVGSDGAEGTKVNIPLRGRSGDSTYRLAHEKLVRPILEEFKPEALIVSFGADAHYKDPLASMTLSSPAYLEIIGWLLDFGKQKCGDRVCFVLEGGYHSWAQAEIIGGTLAHHEGRTWQTEYNDELDINEKGKEYVELAVGVQKEYWKL